MIGFWQTDPRLSPVVQKYGCAVLDSLYLMPDDYTPEEVNDVWSLAQSDGRILPADHPTHSNEISNWLVWLASLWSVKKNDRPLSFVRKTLRDYHCQEGEREILKWYLSNVKENHFTVGNGAGDTVWDSMNRPDIMGRYASFVEKIIVKET